MEYGKAARISHNTRDLGIDAERAQERRYERDFIASYVSSTCGFIERRRRCLDVAKHALAIVRKQFFDTLQTRRPQDQPRVMVFTETPDDLGIIVFGSVGILQAGQRDQQARIFAARLR